MNLFNTYKEGVEIATAERAKIEEQFVGYMRGGNTGYVANGEIHGRCARKAVLRYYGVNSSYPLSRSIMFKAGEMMEDLLISKLSLATDLKILTQTEAGVTWDCDGTKVKCSPDIVFVDDKKVPQLGVEVKMVSSIWTLRNVTPFSTITGKPKADHLAQAAHYALKLGEKYGEDYIPWKIAYICPVDFHAHTKDLRESASQSEFLIRQDTGKREVFKVESHLVVYDVSFDRTGRVLYKLEDSTEYTPTEITAKGIDDFYKLVGEHARNKTMPPRMVNTDCYGKKLKWSAYDPKYNDLADLHDKYDAGDITFDQFITEAKKR